MCAHDRYDIAIDDDEAAWKLVCVCMDCGEHFEHDRDSVITRSRVPILRTIHEYFALRRLAWPDPAEAFSWAVSEMGEVAENLLMRDPKWIRNDPAKTGKVSTDIELAYEVADVIMMLTILCVDRGVDPFAALELKMLSKIVHIHNMGV